MAAFTVSQYGKFVSLQNNSGSADAAAPNGGIYLFASGAVGSARLYLQNEGGTVTDLAKAVDIDAFTAGSSLHQTQDHFLFSDNGTEKKITFSDLEDAIFGNVSGDAAIAAGGALTIANDAVEQAMIADDAVGADQLAANAVVNASIASNAAIDMDKLDGGSLASSLSDLAQGDLLYAGDVDDSNNIKSITFSDLEDAIFGNVSGDVAVAAGGAVTIQADAVESGMLNDNVISGQTELASDGLAAADEMMISDGGTLKKIGVDNLMKDAPGLLAAADVAVGDDHFMFLDGGATGDAKTESVADLMTAVAGDGLAASSGVLAVQASGSVVLSSDKLGISGSIAGDGLTYAGGVNSISSLKLDISEYSDVAVASGDKFLMLDSNGSTHQLESVDDISTFMAGDGLAASSGVLAVQVDDTGIELNSDALRLKDNGVTLAKMAGITRGSIIVGDSSGDPSLLAKGSAAQFLQSDGTDPSYVTISGDATVAAGGALTIANDAVEQAMIADDAVGADQLAANAVVNASVASNAAIEGTKLNLNVDMGGNFQIGNQSDDVAAFGGPIKVGGNSIFDGGSNSSITFDGSGNTQAVNNLTVGTDGGGKQFTVHGAAANEFMRYVPGDNQLKFQDSSSGTILTLGGDATGEYAVDVTEGSNNINKIRAAAFVTYSDESLKQDVQTMNTALDTIMSLNGVEFTWKNSGERDFGFIAQDVQAVLPKAVHVASDGVQGVDYSRLTSVLVEAVKAQQVQIEELKTLLKK